MKTILFAALILTAASATAGAWESVRNLIYIEPAGVESALEDYDSVEYITGKSERHYRQAWTLPYNEDMYVGQCMNALKDQAALIGGNSVLNMTWTLRREYPENWYTVVCQGLAAWKY
ncbi:MAG: hypothetical protein KJ002_05850 [Candidatus Dadabacteria bacterium]|nr:hypothetical protein [Candidatus Dadabacteria bacterium]